MGEQNTEDRSQKTGDRRTSKSVAALASDVLKDPKSTDAEKSVAASALSQARDATEDREPLPDLEVGKDGLPPPASGKKLLNFKDDFKSPTLGIGQGEYRRRFVAADQPFEVDNEEEFQMLLREGFFEEVTEDRRP